MTTLEAKESVIMAGKKLVETGLIARTWGNVSCRISNSHFVITPSGRDYMGLTPDEIVEVSISDCSYNGDVKPSSEKGIHAEVYMLHPGINFVIHTHQEYASSISTLMLNSINVSEKYPQFSGEILLANYGLPGTKKLRKNVAKALAHTKGKAVIMKKHGALCFGKDYEETFDVAKNLEEACKAFIWDSYTMQGNRSNQDPVQLGCFALTKLTGEVIKYVPSNALTSCESLRTKTGFKLILEGRSIDFPQKKLENSLQMDDFIKSEAKIHDYIYSTNNSINYIIHSNTPGIAAVSLADITIKPLLDDFAQIAGTSVKTVEFNPLSITGALRKSSAVFIKNKGALCCGPSKGDAQAVCMVVEKNCMALISSALFGKVEYLSYFDSILMRLVYKNKYSKQAQIK